MIKYVESGELNSYSGLRLVIKHRKASGQQGYQESSQHTINHVLIVSCFLHYFAFNLCIELFYVVSGIIFFFRAIRASGSAVSEQGLFLLKT